MSRPHHDDIILDLAGGTGAWSAPYREAGYDVRNITLPDYDLTDERVVGRFRDINAHGILFATDCTAFANSGARWFWERTTAEVWHYIRVFIKGYRIIEQQRLYNPSLAFWAIENPIGKMRELLGDPDFIFDPCDFGDPYTKRTLLWGDFHLPRKAPVEPVEGSKMHKVPPSELRKMLRSVTPPGFAKAFFEANP